jgi:hypothetical protein
VSEPEGSPVPRRDRTSRIIAIVIVAAIIVPVIWLVVDAALSGRTSLDPGGGTTTVSTTVPTPGS